MKSGNILQVESDESAEGSVELPKYEEHNEIPVPTKEEDREVTKEVPLEEELEEQGNHEFTIVKEISEYRKSNEKTYLLEDGTLLVEIHQTDIHYEDMSGNYQEINTTLMDERELLESPTLLEDQVFSKESESYINEIQKKLLKPQGKSTLSEDDSSYTTLQTPFIVDIPKRFTKGYGIELRENHVKFIPINASHSSKAVLDPAQPNKVTYKDAWPNTDVELIVNSEGIKENIILKNSESPNSIRFEVNGNIDAFNVLPAWLADSNGITREVSMKTTKENGRTFIELTWDTDGLSYPIVIDPTVNGNLSRFVNVNLGSSFVVGADQIVIGGKKSTTSFTETYRTYLKYSFKKGGFAVNSAFLRFNTRGYSLNQSETTAIVLQPRFAVGDWNDPMNATNMPMLFGNPSDLPSRGVALYPSVTAHPTYDIDVVRLLSGINNGEVHIALTAINSNAVVSSGSTSETVYFFSPPTLMVNITDVYKPQSPTNLEVIESSSTGVTLGWSAATDDFGVIRYEILKDGVFIGTTAETNYTITNLVPSTESRFTVRAIDGSNNVSAESSPLMVSISKLPKVQILSPIENVTLPQPLTINWNYSDPTGKPMTGVQIKASKDNWVTTEYDSGPKAPSTNEILPKLQAGKWNFAVRVKNSLGWGAWVYLNNVNLTDTSLTSNNVYTYSKNGQLQSIDITVGTDKYKQTYHYDLNGNLLKITTVKLT